MRLRFGSGLTFVSLLWLMAHAKDASACGGCFVSIYFAQPLLYGRDVCRAPHDEDREPRSLSIPATSYA